MPPLLFMALVNHSGFVSGIPQCNDHPVIPNGIPLSKIHAPRSPHGTEASTPRQAMEA
jgi:hypothetical protein